MRSFAVGCLAGLALTLVATTPASAAAAVAAAVPEVPGEAATEPLTPRPRVEAALVGDDQPGLLERRRRDARDLAVQGTLDGSLAPSLDGSVVELPAGEVATTGLGRTTPPTTPYGEVATTGIDQVLTLLVDFGPGDYADRTRNGPVHGQLPDPLHASSGPDRSLLQTDPTRYEQLLFGTDGWSLARYLDDQSGGTYGIHGVVHPWVAVPYNAAYYGVDACDGEECGGRVAEFATDAVDAFVADFYARDPAGDLRAFLSPYDRRDRYDSDADGDFTEPDGYLDRVVLVFAGRAQEDASADTDRLRSRFGSVAGDAIGTSGPAGNPWGGHELGSSGIWVDAFSAVPEDAGLGTLVHTYGHDLGLVDLADPAGLAAVDTSVQFWSPMASGSRLDASTLGSHRGADAAGLLDVTPPALLAAERLLLGWLDYRDVTASTSSQTVELADPSGESDASDTGVPAEARTGAALVRLGPLPYTTRVASPAVGERAFVAANGPASEAILAMALPPDARRVTWRQWTDTEPVFDAVRLQARRDGGWADIASMSTGRQDWATRSVPLPEGATDLRFVYSTDAASTGAGVLLDEIRVDGAAAEGAEGGLPAAWTASGWTAGDGTVASTAPAFYLAERRDLSGLDAALETAPFVADPHEGVAAVDHFGYDGGVLVTLWDQRAADNNVSAHPGSGRLLVVDARPTPVETAAGATAPLGLHPFDAAFGTSWLRGFSVDAYSLAAGGEVAADRVRVRAQPPVPTFDDTDPRYAAGTGGQPRLPALGVTMTVTSEGATGTTVQFAPARSGPVPAPPDAGRPTPIPPVGLP